eukprot:SAG31_NODE_1987_length_6724_cov_18.235925_7_plen_96_part_00
MKNNGDSAAKYEADDLEEQQLPGTPPPTVDSSPASVRGKMISSVMKTMKSPDSGDLTQLTRQITFKKKVCTAGWPPQPSHGHLISALLAAATDPA